jgi:hypothetical protein
MVCSSAFYLNHDGDGISDGFPFSHCWDDSMIVSLSNSYLRNIFSHVSLICGLGDIKYTIEMIWL